MSGDRTDRIWNVLEAVLGVPREAITSEARLDELAPLDSLSLAELASALDREFSIAVPGEELTTALRVAELVTIVEAAQRGAGAAPGERGR